MKNSLGKADVAHIIYVPEDNVVNETCVDCEDAKFAEQQRLKLLRQRLRKNTTPEPQREDSEDEDEICENCETDSVAQLQGGDTTELDAEIAQPDPLSINAAEIDEPTTQTDFLAPTTLPEEPPITTADNIIPVILPGQQSMMPWSQPLLSQHFVTLTHPPMVPILPSQDGSDAMIHQAPGTYDYHHHHHHYHHHSPIGAADDSIENNLQGISEYQQIFQKHHALLPPQLIPQLDPPMWADLDKRLGYLELLKQALFHRSHQYHDDHHCHHDGCCNEKQKYTAELEQAYPQLLSILSSSQVDDILRDGNGKKIFGNRAQEEYVVPALVISVVDAVEGVLKGEPVTSVVGLGRSVTEVGAKAVESWLDTAEKTTTEAVPTVANMLGLSFTAPQAAQFLRKMQN